MEHKCEYEHWVNGRIEKCGRSGSREMSAMTGSGWNTVHLCPFHAEFVYDASDCKKAKGKHPSEWNWLEKAKRSYGIPRYSLNSAFPYGIPASAGPVPKVWGTA